MQHEEKYGEVNMHLNPYLKSSLLLAGWFSLSLSHIISHTAYADTQLTYADLGLGQSARTTSIFIKGDTVRMEEVGSGVYSLYDKHKGTLYTVNPEAKQYIETNHALMKQRTETAMALQEEAKAQMKQQIAQLPEEQRQIAEAQMQQAEAMRQAPPPTVSHQATGQQDQVQGVPCSVNVVLFDEQPVRAVCNANQALVDESDMNTLMAMFGYMDELAREAAKLQDMPIPPKEMGSASIHQQGLALKIQALPQGPRSELIALSREPLPENMFVLPEDFEAFDPTAAMNEQAQGQ